MKEVLIGLISLVGRGFILSWGAIFFVQSASHISRRFGNPPVIIGPTVVAFGTSAPELAVNALALHPPSDPPGNNSKECGERI